MDDLRCWIVIPWAQYPAPEMPERGIGKATGQLCMGHLIPDIEHLDNIINRKKGPPSYPRDMPAMKIRSHDIKHDFGNDRARGVDIRGSAPIAAATGVTATASASLAFQRTVHDWWQYESMDFLTIMPTREYIEDSISNRDGDTVKLSTGLGSSWTIYMISGLVVARGGIVGSERGRSNTFGVGLGAGLASIADAGFNTNKEDEGNFSTSRQTMTSHIFAIRLTTVFKRRHKREWDYETLFYKDTSIGGVFSADDRAAEKRHTQQVIPNISGLSDAITIGLEEDDDDEDVFIIPKATSRCDQRRLESSNAPRGK